MTTTKKTAKKTAARKTTRKKVASSTSSRTKATKPKEQTVAIQPIDIRTISLTLKGNTPLVVNKWSEKAKEMIRTKTQGKAKNKRSARKPKEEFEAAQYVHGKGRGKKHGFPATAFKKSAANAFRMVEGIKKVEIMGSFHILADFVTEDGTECVQITGDKPIMREDTVRLAGMGRPADLRYRPEYRKWQATLTIEYNHNTMTPEQIVNLFNNAGFGVGVGENRPEKGGSWGRFRVTA